MGDSRDVTRPVKAFRASIWHGSDYPVWEAFISKMQQRLTGAAPEA